MEEDFYKIAEVLDEDTVDKIKKFIEQENTKAYLEGYKYAIAVLESGLVKIK